MKETNLDFNITEDSFDSRIIKKFDGKSATDTFIEKIGWKNMPIKNLDKFYRMSFFYPLASKKDNLWCPNVIAGFLGDNLPLGHKVYGKKLKVLSASGETFVNAAYDLVSSLKNKKINFIFSVSCAAILETLGDKIYKIKEIIEKNIKTDYLVIFAGSEGIKIPKKQPLYFNETFNILAF
jgi:hypothetical protein